MNGPTAACLLVAAWVAAPLGAQEPPTTEVTGYEVIDIPVGRQGAEGAPPRPGRGMSAAAVAARYGEPRERTPAVGEPPISRWHYPGFTVYFEGDTVIHSVLRHRPRSSRQPSR